MKNILLRLTSINLLILSTFLYSCKKESMIEPSANNNNPTAQPTLNKITVLSESDTTCQFMLEIHRIGTQMTDTIVNTVWGTLDSNPGMNSTDTNFDLMPGDLIKVTTYTNDPLRIRHYKINLLIDDSLRANVDQVATFAQCEGRYFQ